MPATGRLWRNTTGQAASSFARFVFLLSACASLVSCQSLEGYYSDRKEDIQSYCKKAQRSVKKISGKIIRGKRSVSAKTFYLCLVEATGHSLKKDSMIWDRNSAIIGWSIGILSLLGVSLWISKFLPSSGARLPLPSPP